MKIRLEKPAMSISNLSGGKNEKARRGWGWGGRGGGWGWLYMKNFG